MKKDLSFKAMQILYNHTWILLLPVQISEYIKSQSDIPQEAVINIRQNIECNQQIVND